MRRTHPRFLSGLSLALAVVLGAGRASAQCAITGPDQVCASPVTLCGPSTGSMFQWTLPDGSGAWDPCIDITTPGTYTLLYLDGVTGLWLGPCTKTISTVGSTPSPSISGPATACDGTDPPGTARPQTARGRPGHISVLASWPRRWQAVV